MSAATGEDRRGLRTAALALLLAAVGVAALLSSRATRPALAPSDRAPVAVPDAAPDAPGLRRAPPAHERERAEPLPADPTPSATGIDLLLVNEDPAVVGAPADVVVLSADGAEVARVAARIPAVGADARLPLEGAGRRVALDVEGAALRVADVVAGRATIRVRRADGMALLGRAITGDGRAAAGIDLVVANDLDAEVLRDVAARARGAVARRTSVRVRTGPDGAFRVASWDGGPRAFVRVLTPGWTRVGLTPDERRGIAVATDHTPFVVPETAGAASPHAIVVGVGETLWLAARVRAPEVAGLSAEAARRLLRVDFGVRVRPPFPVQQLGWSIVGAMPVPLPAGVVAEAVGVALADVSGLDLDAVPCGGSVRFPGASPTRFRARLTTFAALEPADVTLAPAAPLAVARVRFLLLDAPASLLALDGPDAFLSVDAVDLAQESAGAWTVGVRWSRGVSEDLVVPAARYRFSIPASLDAPEIDASADRTAEVAFRCRALCGLDVEVGSERGADLEAAVWVSRRAEGAVEPPTVVAGPPANLGGGTDGLVVAASVVRPGLRRFWFAAPASDVAVVAHPLVGPVTSRRVRLREGETVRVRLP